MSHSALRATRPRCNPLLLALLGSLFATGDVHAAAFAVPVTNTAGWGRATAGGSLFPDDPSAAFNNPSAMAFFSGAVLQGSATYARISERFQGSAQDYTGAPMSGGQGGAAGFKAVLPAVFYVKPINDRLAFGLAQVAPFGMRSTYQPDWVGRNFADTTNIRSVGISLSASYKVNDEFAIGVGVIGQHTNGVVSQTLDLGGALGSSPIAIAEGIGGIPQIAQPLIDVKVSNTSAGWFGGFTWKPTTSDTLDLSYHAKINNGLHGRYTIYGNDLDSAFLAIVPVFYPGININPNGAAAAAQLDIPANASLDWVHRFGERFTLGTTLTWTGWSSFQDLTLASNGSTIVTIPYHYRDTVFGAIGGDYQLNDKWVLRAGAAYDQTPTRNATRDPRIPDGDRYFASIGAAYKASDKLSIDLAYSHQFVKDGTIHLTNQPILGGGRIDGAVNNRGDELSVGATYRF